MKRLVSLLFPCMFLCTALLSCRRGADAHLAAHLEALYGRRIVLPDQLVVAGPEGTLPFSRPAHSAPLSIICYIDSVECTACRLSDLMTWYTFDEYVYQRTPSRPEVMPAVVIATRDTASVNSYVRLFRYDFPILIDTAHRFAALNDLPPEEVLHTFLLDSEDRIELVGWPFLNDKSIALYRRTIERLVKQLHEKE